MNDQLPLILCVFCAIAAAGYFVSRLLAGDGSGEKLRNRLSAGAAARPVTHKTPGVPILQRLGQAAARPFMPEKRETQSSLRKALGFAGIYSPSAIKMVTGCKVICLVFGLIGGYLLGFVLNSLILGLSVGGLIGYILPTVWLKLRVKSNQKALTYGLPDALDLMVVCVEAGLTIDGAMQRVGQELTLAHPALARELGIAHMETRVGLSRSESMKNLGVRTGNAALTSLAAMLIQADRFGTSIAQALRIHAETLRIARQHAAEEQAAKAAVKMSFPLVLFIFPATFIVLAGPTIIGLFNSALFK